MTAHFSTPHVVGLIGDPIAHSRSPQWHNDHYLRHRLPYVYLPLRVTAAQLRKVPLLMQLCDIDGLNVTAPHKVAVARLMGTLDRDAQLTGAVNTIRRVRQTLRGYNTDVPGFRDALQQEWQIEARGRHVAILGTGGAARAVAVCVLQDRCASLTILGRSPAKRAALVRHLQRHFPRRAIAAQPLNLPALRQALATCALLIQATSDPAKITAILKTALRNHPALAIRYYYDCCYWQPLPRSLFPPTVHVADGTSLLTAQALRSIQIWTGKR